MPIGTGPYTKDWSWNIDPNTPFVPAGNRTSGQPQNTTQQPAPPQKQQPQQPEPPKFDPLQQVGHNGSINGLNREAYRDKWLSSGGKTMDDLNKFISQYGGKVVSGNGTVYTPFGEQIDMLHAARTGNGSAQWMGVGNTPKPAAQPAAQSMPAPTAAPMSAPSGASPASPATPTTAATGAQPGQTPLTAQEQELYKQLMDRAHQTLNIDPNDPTIKNQVDAYSAAQQRARRQYLSDTAESSSPYNTGSMRNEERMTGESLGQNVSGFQGQLMQNELNSRRQEIQSALDSMGGLLTEKDRQALQEELAKIDDATKRYGIDTQNSQFYANLNESDKQFFAQLAQASRLANAQLGYNYASLGQNQNQFLDRLGFDTAHENAYWDAVNRGVIGGG